MGLPMFAESPSLKVYLAKRAVRSFLLVLGIISVGFVLINLAPGDPIEYVLGHHGFYTPEFIAEMRARFGLDRPIHERFLRYLLNVLTGNLGYSYVYGLPVMEVILDRVPPTILLMGSQLALVILIGVPLGVLAARRPYSMLDGAISAVSLIGVSTPVFWLGLILIQLFSITLGLFPAQGMFSLRATGLFERFIDVMYHLFLPALTLVLINLGLITRVTRASMLEALRSEYIVAARAKGLRERTILLKHALRNSLLPIITIVGMQIGWMLSGAVLVETLFAWPGMGRLLFTSIEARDYPVIMGIFLLIAISVVVSNFIVDVLYGYLDPRIRRRG